MSSANCPTCGGPIEFKIASSFLVVCPYCKSAIAREDRQLKDLGKVAALVETDSPLSIGMTGKYFSATFRLTGRSQLRHQLGGVWDEWYAAFSDGRWGWLAEAQGRYYMTFASPLPNPPKIEALVAGANAPGMPVPMVVSEIGSAHYTSAEGEIPFALVPGEALKYADLSGANGLFATLDVTDDPPTFYAGREVTLNELAVDTSAAQAKKEKHVQITNLACPNCGGSLELRAPDETERVGCPHCGSLLDCANGKFEILQALSSKLEKPLLPLGAQAEFEGVKQIVIGFMVRSCIVEGVKYFWREYLLYSKERGFRWLVHSDNHWTYVKNFPASEAKLFEKYATYQGQHFKRFQDAPASVELVIGEFYWKVSVGETVQASDFINPPRMISREYMKYSDGGSEVAWSVGEYIFPAEIQTKFKLPFLAKPSTVGACEPFRHTGYLWRWAALFVALIVLSIAFEVVRPYHDVLNEEIRMEPLPATPAVVQPPPPNPGDPATPADATASPPSESGQVYLSKPFKLNAREFVHVQVEAPLDNSWLSMDCDLINEATGEVQPFGLDLEYYHGVDEGESWSEGSKTRDISLSALPEGEYVLRVEAHWDKPQNPIGFRMIVGQSSGNAGHWMLVFLWISVIPLIVLVMKYMHYSARWKESMYGGGSGD